MKCICGHREKVHTGCVNCSCTGYRPDLFKEERDKLYTLYLDNLSSFIDTYKDYIGDFLTGDEESLLGNINWLERDYKELITYLRDTRFKSFQQRTKSLLKDVDLLLDKFKRELHKQRIETKPTVDKL